MRLCRETEVDSVGRPYDFLMTRWSIPRGDLALGVILTVIGQVELALARDRVDGPLWLQHVGFALMTVPVIGRRVAPLPAVLVCAVGVVVQTWAGFAPVVAGFLAMLVLLASLGYHASRREGLIGLGAMLLAGLSYELFGAPLALGDLLVNVLLLAVAWFGARRIRLHADARVAAELTADRAAREAVVAERSRIARDLHDSVAHALTLIALQSAVARERSNERETDGDTYRSIEELARTGLVDMHRFLRVLGRDGDQEAPGVADLPVLVEGVQRGGRQVALEVHGPVDDVPASIGTTIYRVVQEALTNSVKHATGASTSVRLSVEGDTANVVVTDDGPSRTAHLAPGAGRGLAGITERVRLFGGRLTAGPPVDGPGWVVSAELPLRGGD